MNKKKKKNKSNEKEGWKDTICALRLLQLAPLPELAIEYGNILFQHWTQENKKKQTLTVYSMHMAYRYKQAYMQKETHLEKKIILLTNGQQKRKYEQKEERKKNTW